LVILAGGTVGVAQSAPTGADSLSLDEIWFSSLARAESIVSAASSRGEVDSTDRAAVVEQIRIGVHVLGSFVQASIAADTVLAGPLVTVRPPEPPARGRGIQRATRVLSAVASLVHVLATLGGAGPQARAVLAFVAGSTAGMGGVMTALTARPPPQSIMDNSERMRAFDLGTDLIDSVHGTERAAELLWVELRSMALDSSATDEQVVWLARRYANALQGTSVLVDSRVATTLAIVRSCAECPGFVAESRDRCGALASHLDAVGALWQDRAWLLERAKRNTLDYLILTDRPRGDPAPAGDDDSPSVGTVCRRSARGLERCSP
jgi:hypothetical protein